jgi:hypothetical protein
VFKNNRLIWLVILGLGLAVICLRSPIITTLTGAKPAEAVISLGEDLTPVQKDRVMEYVKDGTMSASLKPVMLKGMLTLADSKGQVDLMELTRYFRKFYEDRADQGLAIEVRGAVVNRIIEMDDYQLANYMLKMPFEKFERKYFVEHKKELNKVAFSPNIWRKLSEAEKEHLINICDKQIRDYYERRVD